MKDWTCYPAHRFNTQPDENTVTTISPREITCPLCTRLFSGFSVLAGPATGPLATDLRRYPEGEDPIPKQLNSCPDCGYSGEVSAFEEFAPDSDQYIASEDSTLMDLVDEHLRPRAAQSHGDPALRYEQHALLEAWLGNGPLRQGDAWLRAAWMHSDGPAVLEASSDAASRRSVAINSAWMSVVGFVAARTWWWSHTS